MTRRYQRPEVRPVTIGLDGQGTGAKDETKSLTGKSRSGMVSATNRSATTRLVSLALLISVSSAPLSSTAALCQLQGQLQDHGRSPLNANSGECGANCCAQPSSSCCGESSARRVCSCSRQHSPPAIPVQQPSSSDRGELCWAETGAITYGLLDDIEVKSTHPSSTTSSSWPTTSLQVVLCRWLT